MAVFGVKGKVETEARKLVDFQFRYTFDFEPQPYCRLHVDMTGPADGDNTDQVDIIQSDLLEGHQQKRHFREAVQSLTRQFESTGMEATVRSFMTPRNTINGAEDGHVNGNRNGTFIGAET